jgi:hypothetical protein
MFLIKKLTFDRMNFLKLSVHVFCLAEKAKLRRTNSRTNCQQNNNRMPTNVESILGRKNPKSVGLPVWHG